MNPSTGTVHAVYACVLCATVCAMLPWNRNWNMLWDQYPDDCYCTRSICVCVNDMIVRLKVKQVGPLSVCPEPGTTSFVIHM
jgi:hypothetical protein